VNTSKSCGYFDLYLNQVRLKFETTAIDSNFSINVCHAAAMADARAKAPSVNRLLQGTDGVKAASATRTPPLKPEKAGILGEPRFTAR
jgi:hypothetical protein